MFLKMLKPTVKESFLDLAILAADSSGGISVEEKNMLKTFAIEMDIKPRYSTRKKFDNVMKTIVKEADDQEKRIVALEILGIMWSDSEYDDTEKEFVGNVTEMLGVDKKLVDKMSKKIKQYADVYMDIVEMVTNF